jgi:hypothetical protein
MDRATKNIISTVNMYNGYYRFKLVPNTNTELVGITTNSYQLANAKFDANGQKLSLNETYPSGNINARIFELFPDGQNFITSMEGMIYTKDLVSVVLLPHGNHEYSDFAFNASGSVIYTSCGNSKTIVAYSMPGYSELKQFQTKGYPYFIFADNNTLICLSNTSREYYTYSSPADYIIEKIPMSK